MSESEKAIKEATTGEYKYGFTTDVESDKAPKGLNEDIIRLISSKKNEPEWLLEWRLKAFKVWQSMEEPTWAHVQYPEVNFQDIIYYSAPKPKKVLNSLDEVDPEIIKTFNKLGIPLEEQKNTFGCGGGCGNGLCFCKNHFQREIDGIGYHLRIFYRWCAKSP